MMFNPQPKSGPKPKKEKKPLKRSPIKYKKKNTGQVDTFEAIAETEEWACYVYGEKLWQLGPENFAHILPKALNKYPKMKNDPRNIVILSMRAHMEWDHGPRSALKDKPEWEKMFVLEKELKQIYQEEYGK